MRISNRSMRAASACAVACFLVAGAPAPAPAIPARVVPLKIDWSLTAPQIAASCASELKSAKQRIDAIVRRRSARTFQSVFVDFENVSADVSDDLAAQTFLFQVSPDAAVRDASEKCGADVADVFAEESARPDLYAAMVAAGKSQTALTPADKKLQEIYLVEGRRAGAALAAPQRREFVALEQQITKLEQSFAKNLADDATTITLTPTQAASLPTDITQDLKNDPSGADVLPVNESTIVAFMDNESDESARQAYYTAYERRGGMQNVDLLQQALVARARIAVLLGYPNWAGYVLADKMAKTPAHVATFLGNLDTALLPTARAQYATLQAAKGSPLHAWDVSYYENQIKKSKYNLDENVVKQYFPAQHTIDAIVAIYSKMLGLTIALVPNAPVWYKGVYAYDVSDTKSGEYRGRFYLDLFPRPGKYDHFANAGPTERRIMPDGTIRPVVNSILGNWPAPSGGKPSLLSHGDVETFFHEFGHNVAALCSNTPYETLNGGFRSDFIEAPSQMLENFVWDPAILKQISSNVDTGAPLPDDVIKKMNDARYFDEARATILQVFYATVDQEYHTLPQPIDTTAVWKASYDRLTPGTFIDGTYPQAGFGHLMGGYEAGYYGYLYSKVYAQDIFTVFKAGGLENPVIGARYRSDILAPARMEEPDQEVRAFLGRPMSPKAFYDELGIATPGM